MRIIGITGPSGSGKTLLTEHLSALGVPTINADELYHSMLVPPSKCLDAIRESFGDTVFAPDGALDREALSRTVFSDEEKLALLNETVLGIVISEIRKIINTLAESGERAVAVDAPTLIESGFDRECDDVICVLCPAKERASRISERDHITPERAQARIRAQKDDAFYTERSDYVIINDGTAEDFDKKILKLIYQLGITQTPDERNA